MNNKNEVLDIENGLYLREIKSDVPVHGEKELPDLVSLNQFIKEKFKTDPDMAVCYFDYGIRFARWKKNALQFYNDKEKYDPRYLLEARIFNQDAELKIWKTSEKFSYRLRQDNTGETCDVIEATQNLWGTTPKIDGEWSILTEDRGVELIIPMKVTDKKISEPHVAIKTRNYIGKLPNDQATYQDCRFVELVLVPPVGKDAPEITSDVQNN